MLRRLMIVLLLTVGAVSVSAQAQTENPFLDLLARVPNSPASHAYFTYIDYQALFATRPNAPAITSWQEYEQVREADSPASAAFRGALLGISSGPQVFSQYFAYGSDFPATVGFDFFQIERAAEFGQPPGSVTVLVGDFDPQAITAAHAARGYTESETGGITLLCGAVGCDQGARFDLSNRNLANPFGGEFGRSQPVIVTDDMIASSTDLEQLEATASATAGESTSLADQPDYHAAAEAMTAHGTLVQAYFVNPLDVLPDSFNLDRTPAPADEVTPLPAYTLLAIGDTVTETEEQALIALVYTDRTVAKAVAAQFPARLTDARSLVTNTTFGDILSTRGVTSIDAVVYPASTARYVVVITLHAPLPPAEPEGDQVQASALVYSVLTRAYFARDLAWLAALP